MASGHLEFEEIGDRFETVYKAETVTDLEPAVGDLPAFESISPSHPAPSQDFKLVGDIKRTIGDLGGGYKCVSVIGDIRLDLSSVDLSSGDVNVTCWSFVGDVTIIVPDGVRVHHGGMTIIGDGTEALVSPAAGGPLIGVEVFQLVGDRKIYSLSLLPKGRLRKWWRSLRAVG